MKQEAVKDLSVDQLFDKLIEQRKTHMELRFQHAAGQVENISQIKKARRTIARLKTEMVVRETKKKGVKTNA